MGCKVSLIDKQLSRFPRNEKFDFKGKIRWTFGGKSGHDAILEEMEKWRSDLYAVVTAIKLLQEEEQSEARDLYNQLFAEEVGGRAVHSANVMDELVRSSGSGSDDQTGTTQKSELEASLDLPIQTTFTKMVIAKSSNHAPSSSSTATSNRDRLKRLETSSRTSKNSPSLSPKLTHPPCTSSAVKGPSISPILSDLF